MTPLVLVTGFLGAGKTTFLRALLPALSRHGLRARVVLNDFGDARVDAATLADVAPDLVALSGSCVCCESLDEMVAVLAGLHPGAQEVVLVEANGGTEASELVGLLGAEPALDHLSPPLQLTVVDAKRFGARDWQNVMEREQLATATHLALGRIDLVAPDRAEQVRREVSAAAPRAAWVTPDSFAALLAEIEPEIRATANRLALIAAGGAAPPAGDRPDHAPADHCMSIRPPIISRRCWSGCPRRSMPGASWTSWPGCPRRSCAPRASCCCAIRRAKSAVFRRWTAKRRSRPVSWPTPKRWNRARSSSAPTCPSP